MKQVIYILSFSLLFVIYTSDLLTAQTTADFEDFNLEQDTFLNGSLGEQGFNNGNIFLPNSYNDAWGTWAGWSISNVTDNITAGFTNQYSSIAGQGAEGSDTYATAYVFDPVMINMTDEGVGVLEGMHISNSTYGFISMRDGDAFAKKFGGITGDDPDFLLLTIRRWWSGITVGDDVEFYLADFRFDDPNEDYILSDWTYVPFNEFAGNVDSVELILTSSDVGMFGMNTPAYICMDNFVTSDVLLTSTQEQQNNDLTIYPNPADDVLIIKSDIEYQSVIIYDHIGNLVSRILTNESRINVADLPAGVYLISIQNEQGISSVKFVKA